MLDWERIEELRTEIGEEDFAEVAEVFLDELDDVIGQLREGGSDKEVRERLHFLKGCALNLGFAEMAALATDGHGLAQQDVAPDVNLATLFKVYTASRAEFEARMQDADAA